MWRVARTTDLRTKSALVNWERAVGKREKMATEEEGKGYQEDIVER
jgi:hypothetical protein